MTQGSLVRSRGQLWAAKVTCILWICLSSVFGQPSKFENHTWRDQHSPRYPLSSCCGCARISLPFSLSSPLLLSSLFSLAGGEFPNSSKQSRLTRLWLSRTVPVLSLSTDAMAADLAGQSGCLCVLVGGLSGMVNCCYVHAVSRCAWALPQGLCPFSLASERQVAKMPALRSWFRCCVSGWLWAIHDVSGTWFPLGVRKAWTRLVVFKYVISRSLLSNRILHRDPVCRTQGVCGGKSTR